MTEIRRAVFLSWIFVLCIPSDILKKFNPSLRGFSKDQLPRQKGFNMAMAGAKTSWVHVCFSSSTWVKTSEPNHCGFSPPAPMSFCYRDIPGQVQALIKAMREDKVRLLSNLCNLCKSLHVWLKYGFSLNAGVLLRRGWILKRTGNLWQYSSGAMIFAIIAQTK